MRGPYKTTGKLQQTYIKKFKAQDPTLTDEQALEMYKEYMRSLGSKGGAAPTGPFATVPGLAKRAVHKRFHGEDERKGR